MNKILLWVTKLLALICIATTIGCASTGEFKAFLADKDQFSPDTVHYFTSAVSIKEVSFGESSWSYLRLHYQKTNNNIIWYIGTFYSSEHWLFIQNLRFIVDGKIYTFQSQPSPKRETGTFPNVHIEETNQFVLSDAFLADMLKAQSVTIRLEGKDYFQDKTLDPSEVKNLIWFINYASAQGASSSHN